MSIEAPNWYTVQYDQKVNHLLQSEGFLLRGTTQPPVEVTGNTLQFFVLGKGTAMPMTQSIEMVQPANLAKTTVTATMQDFQFAEFVRHGEPERISVEYRGAIQEAGAMALGRKFDRVIMAELDANRGSMTQIGNGSAAIDPAQVSQGKAGINALGMMKMNEFFLPLPSMAWEQLKLYKVVSNSQYVGPKLSFVGNTEAATWNGVNLLQCPDELFTSPSTGVVDTYLWNKRTVGFGSNYALQTRITYENLFTAWLYNSTMSGQAKVIQVPGVVNYRIKIDGALSLSGT